MNTTQTRDELTIDHHRWTLLKAIEQFVAAEYAALSTQDLSAADFRPYTDFLSPPVFDLVAWEQITREEVKRMPALKAHFVSAYNAAWSARFHFGIRDKEHDRGNPQRKFKQIAAAELATNILPRLRNILDCRGLRGEQGPMAADSNKPVGGGIKSW